ncbi:MAG: class I SAM-dependent methyltransferase [Actinobacteria bacterium]|nr:class I SAM-dependent methyltransferase [Actinomycetota bacterium]
MSTRWSGTDAPRGDEYDARWARLAEAGQSIHGEADLVDALLGEHGGRRVLDAGCGTGRVAIELAARGYDVVGVDLDAGMLNAARAKAPAIAWVEADLAHLDAVTELPAGGGGVGFDLVVMAGNVMIFVDPGTEGAVLRRLRDRTVAGGLLVAGFQVRPDRLALDDYDRLAADAGFSPVARFATWDREPYAGGDYAVSVHRAD